MNAVLEMPETMTNEEPQKAMTVPNGIERIVLTGFMGSGKTTAGRLLAERLGWQFHDLDDEIERRTGRTVPEIFAEQGEDAFRRAESNALAGLLGTHRSVIALGGGAPEVLGNQLLLEQTPHTTVVYLSAPLEVLVARCEGQAAAEEGAVRPLLGQAAARFKARHPMYERVAKHRVSTSDLTVEDVVEAVLRVLGN